MFFSEDNEMEYIVIIIIAIITVLLLKIGLNVHIKDLKKITRNKFKISKLEK